LCLPLLSIQELVPIAIQVPSRAAPDCRLAH
jgi:hypothetical protein